MEFINRNPKIFALSGKASSGKNTTANIIKNYYKEKKVIEISFAYYIKDYAKRITGWDGSEETKPRELLQNIGIELVRDKIDPKLFINRVLQDIVVFSYFYDIIIITDVRLVDEIESLKEKINNLISIRISRSNYESGLTSNEQQHKTEVDLDNYNKFDYILENKDINELENKIINILKEV